jgi:hypothetical protein
MAQETITSAVETTYKNENEIPPGSVPSARGGSRGMNPPRKARLDKRNQLLQRAWSNARAVIKEENEIANHRITALIAINSFSFVAIGVALSCFADDSNAGYGRVGAIVVALLASIIGFCSAWSSGPTIRSAYRQIHATNDWWYRFKKSLTCEGDTAYWSRHPFPPVTGRNARCWFIPFRRSQHKADAQEGNLRDGNQYVSHRFIWFLKKQQDDEYGDFELDQPTDAPGNHLLDQKREPPQYGLAKWPGFLQWIWAFILVVSFTCTAVFIQQEYLAGAAPSAGPANAEVSVVRDPNTREASISFHGDGDRVKDLMKQLELVAKQ